MRTNKWLVILLILVTLILIIPTGCELGKAKSTTIVTVVTMPEAAKDSDTSIEEALLGIKSTTSFSEKAITKQQLIQLLWAAFEGSKDPSGLRAASWDLRFYPIEICVVVRNVKGLEPNVYACEQYSQYLEKIRTGDYTQALVNVVTEKSSVSQAAVNIIIMAAMTEPLQYGDRGERYFYMEAGHIAQNICLQAVGLKLGALTVGDFDDKGVQNALQFVDFMKPLYIISIGNPID